MVFSSWDAILRLFVVGVPSYFALVLMLRLTGKRTLSQFNAFDFIVTIALGSTLASTLISKQVALVDGILALALLIALQVLVSWTSVRWEGFQAFMKSEPTLLAYDGRPLQAVLRRQRITHEEVLATVRENGLPDLAAAHAVILETNGRMSVIAEEPAGEVGALHAVQGYGRDS